MPDSTRFSVYGRLIAKPGQRDALIAQFADLLRTGIAGLEYCTINAALDDQDTIWVTQTWRDRAAHDAGTRSAAVVSATARLMSLVAEPPEGAYGEVSHLHVGGPAADCTRHRSASDLHFPSG
jgi:quinol monooxygenase YgiN